MYYFYYYNIKFDIYFYIIYYANMAMNKATVIAKLQYICSEEYYNNNNSDLFTLYRDICEYISFLNENISEELLSSLNTELKCVYNESRLGDGEYNDLVYNDCIDVIKDIINTL